MRTLPLKRAFLDNLVGVERTVALSLLQKIDPGNAETIRGVILSFANRLDAAETLSGDEARYLAIALRGCAEEVELFGGPFGYRKPGGGARKLHPLAALYQGKLVDELHDPDRYGLNGKPLPLSDNSEHIGAISTVAEMSGFSTRTIERAYAAYKRLVHRESSPAKTQG